MKICENGVIRDMTTEELATMQDAAAKAEAEEKHRRGAWRYCGIAVSAS